MKALVFKKPIKRSYFISVGIGYNNMHEELDVQFDKPVTKLIKDALVRVDSNIITDRKTYYIKDTMVGAVERRRVLHYNTFRTLNLNTSVGKSFCINQSWSFNMQLGLQYTRLVHETGRQLGADYNIIDFNASRRLHLDNHLALTSGFSTLYNLREHYYLMGECFVNQYVTNWSLETEVTNYPTVFGLKLAVLYVF